jgi:hypothetical protein
MRPHALDPTAAILERYVLPRVLDCRKEFFRAYCEVYEDWANDPIHDSDEFDSAKCERFISLSSRRVESITSRYDKYFIFDCIRTFPLSALKYVCDDLFEDLVVELVKVLSASILASKQTTEVSSVNLILPKKNWSPETLFCDLGGLFGCAFAIVQGRSAYRLAAKGGRIKRPKSSAVPLDVIFRDFSKTALFLVEGIEFFDDPELEFCTQQYDDRRKREGFAVSGLAIQDPVDTPATGRIWWELHKLPSELDLSVQIKLGHQPNQFMVIQTSSYLSWPVSAETYYQVVEAFPDECRTRLGWDPKVFGDLCDALALTLRREACYDRLLPIVGRKNIAYDCDLTRDPRKKSSPKVIHSLNGKAIVVFLESHLTSALSKQLFRRGYQMKNATTLASQFVRRFCGLPEIHHSFEPILFVALSGKRIGVDLILMQEFHELCSRKLICTGGAAGERKGAMFEEFAREFIERELKLSKYSIPIEPNTEMRKLVPGPIDYGDIDFAFMIGTTLVHLDMKSSCRKPAEFRGDYHAIVNRADELRKKMQNRVEPRGEQLGEYLRGRGVCVEAILNFLCVGVVEYIPPGFVELRYGDAPRAVTPGELVSTIRNDDVFKALVSTSKRTSSHIR